MNRLKSPRQVFSTRPFDTHDGRMAPARIMACLSATHWCRKPLRCMNKHACRNICALVNGCPDTAPRKNSSTALHLRESENLSASRGSGYGRPVHRCKSAHPSLQIGPVVPQSVLCRRRLSRELSEFSSHRTIGIGTGKYTTPRQSTLRLGAIDWPPNSGAPLRCGLQWVCWCNVDDAVHLAPSWCDFSRRFWGDFAGLHEIR